MSKKPHNPQPVEVEQPRFMARISGYTSSPFMALDPDAEAPPKHWTDAESKRITGEEDEAKAEARNDRLENERKIAELGGQSLLRKAKKLAATLRR